jgi:hypothetical protein
VHLKTPKSGRGSLKRYELTNLLFFLGLIVALGVLVSFVFHHYGTANQEPSEEADLGVISDAVDPGSDIGMFYLGTKLSETNLQYQSRIQIPGTDDGLIAELFALPGVDEVTVNQKIIMVKKSASSQWEGIRPGVRRIVKNHLHIHY